MATIHNIITKVHFDCTFDLSDVMLRFDGDSYRVRSFTSINLLLYGPGYSFCQLFSNGKAFVNGGRSEAEAKDLVQRYTANLLKLGYLAEIKSQAIVNIVATYEHSDPIKLVDFAEAHNFFYEPEVFPAVYVRQKRIGASINIFHTGKCVILGAKSEEALKSSVRALKAYISAY